MLKILILVLGIVCLANADTMREMACSKNEPLTFCIQNYKVQCEGANYAACVLVGDLQREQKKFNDAKKFYETACDKGNADDDTKVKRNDGVKLEVHNFMQTSCRLLGYLYKEGKGVRKDANKSLLYYKKSCDLGDMGGCFGIGYIYLKGDKGVKADLNLARQFFLGSCNKGYGYSCLLLAKMFANGNGTKQNLQSAREFYGKACDFGEQVGCDKYTEIDSAIEAQKSKKGKKATKKQKSPQKESQKESPQNSVNQAEMDENLTETKSEDSAESSDKNESQNDESKSGESSESNESNELPSDESNESKSAESSESSESSSAESSETPSDKS